MNIKVILEQAILKGIKERHLIMINELIPEEDTTLHMYVCKNRHTHKAKREKLIEMKSNWAIHNYELRDFNPALSLSKI